MTKEELKLEALKYLENFKDCANCKHRWGDCADELDEDCLINNCYSATPKEQNIYLAGAEPREKWIAELEKENAELKADNDARKFAMAMSEKVEKKLRQENAKAKEIIRDFISVAIDYIDKEDKNYSYIVEAEQFLNSEVVK